MSRVVRIVQNPLFGPCLCHVFGAVDRVSVVIICFGGKSNAGVVAGVSGSGEQTYAQFPLAFVDAERINAPARRRIAGYLVRGGMADLKERRLFIVSHT